MSKRTAVILTTYNRPTLVKDCIASVLAQTDTDIRLLIMDDGCNDEARKAISEALLGSEPTGVGLASGGTAYIHEGQGLPFPVVWWQGRDRSLDERRSSIPYSKSINIALNYLLRGEKYVTFVVDDDYLYPESIKARADYLDANPDKHICYGRLRAVQYAANGEFNTWTTATRPVAGMTFPRPTGRRLQVGGGGKRCYFDNGEVDPTTGKDYCEEGFWEPGASRYAIDGRADHNQLLHRVSCLSDCGINFPLLPNGKDVEYWGEDNSHGVGDAIAFEWLASVPGHEFWGVDAWVATKRYSSASMGLGLTEVRE